jgi:hypothetical protein
MLPRILPRQIDYDAFEEHLLRRLGGAIVVNWSALNPLQQEVVLTQAVLMDDREGTLLLREQLEIFIRKHKVTE